MFNEIGYINIVRLVWPILEIYNAFEVSDDTLWIFGNHNITVNPLVIRAIFPFDQIFVTIGALAQL